MSGTFLAVVAILVCQIAKTEDGLKSDARPAELPKMRQLATLANADILESSGLAVSLETPHLFWTHNDSGDGPRLFAFDESGRDLGVVSLEGVTAIDWEDMASFWRGGRGWLLVADVGDNARRRETCQLHLLPEPALNRPTATVHTTITFRYESGPRDCEAVGVDGRSNVVLLASKSILRCEVFSLPLLPAPSDEVLVAEPIANISVPLATALDVSPDGTRAIVLTYADAYEFQRGEGESWSDAFQRQPQVIKMPLRRQGESICYAADSRSLFLTSERQPTPLWIVERTP
ncbi:MAG TPA: hypothetical protein VMM76_08730 [Pirellulaceae bacterium]|nr:hypothetical protein [Pirellulaceae bacterium]